MSRPTQAVMGADEVKSASIGKLLSHAKDQPSAWMEAARRWDALTDERDRLADDLKAAREENDAMAALLALYRKPCESPQARDTKTDAILAARAKRMGETGGFDGSLNCACGRKPSALHVHGGPAEELDAATKTRGRR